MPRTAIRVTVHAALACGVAAGAAAGDTVRFRTSVVSGATTLPDGCRKHEAASQPQLAVDPRDPRTLTAVYLQDGMTAAVGARSTNGGNTWAREAIADATSCAGGPAQRAFTLNPLLAAGPHGAAYFGNSWISPWAPVCEGQVAVPTTLFRAGTVAHRRDDTGWGRGVSPGRDDFSQNLALAADPAHPRHVTAVWTHFENVPNPCTYVPESVLMAAISTDGGRTFSEPTIAALPQGGIIINVRIARASDGALLAVFDSLPAEGAPAAIVRPSEPLRLAAYAIRSSDAGRTWTAPVAAARPSFLPLDDPETGRPVAGSVKFDLATGPGGVAAIVWAELDATNRGIVRLALSLDGGRNWLPERDVLVRDAPLFMPAVAIDAAGGMALFWYDWVDDEAGDEPLSTTARLAISDDLGTTWSVEALADAFDLRATRRDGVPYDGTPLGVYQDIVALPEGFGAIYTVGPPLANAGPTEVWFTRITPR